MRHSRREGGSGEKKEETKKSASEAEEMSQSSAPEEETQCAKTLLLETVLSFLSRTVVGPLHFAAVRGSLTCANRGGPATVRDGSLRFATVREP